jgi:membrane glycosyltransferase
MGVLGYNLFVLNPFRFIVLLSYRSMLCSLATDSVVKHATRKKDIGRYTRKWTDQFIFRIPEQASKPVTFVEDEKGERQRYC